MVRYLANIRAAVPADGATGRPMAPGDREWAVETERLKNGVPVDPDSVAAFKTLSEKHGLALPVEVA